ncbi:MAG: DUF2339 domain-containing protein, partial [Gammaproteobacteria bacterium]|nr:DUF2339 domain-containing protein [Gammaproteobacteria bacterium]
MNKAWYVIAGALVGLVAIGSGRLAFGVLVGMAVAIVIAELRGLSRRVAKLEQEPARYPVAATREADVPHSADDQQIVAAIDAPQKPIVASEVVEASDTQPRDDVSTPQPADRQPEPNPVMETIKGWFTTGNVPVKVGVVVSFFGVAFLLKYAVDHKLLIVPMWLRLVFAGLFGLVLLAVGWRLRERMRIYALSLQGGGVGIIYLTIFAAFRLYGLLPPVPAFVLLALITIPAATLAVVQDARAMAVLAVSGGFLAPILTSTGEGSHVVLFSYYLLLNLTIVGIAWFKSWRELNLVGFLFTFVIGTTWGYKYYRPEYLASTEPFLVAHFLLYQIAAILFALRQPPSLRGVVDGTLIFGTPVVAFALQAGLLRHTEYGLAFSAIGLAVLYGTLGFWLRSRGTAMHLLRDSYFALGVAFATVAVPLAFEAKWTASTWALEGAALVWLGVRQSAPLSRLAGIALILLAGAAFVIGGWHNDAGLPVLNGNVLGGSSLSVAGFFAARQLGRMDHKLARFAAIGLFVWGTVWWVATGLAEIDDRLRHAMQYPAIVAFFALSGVVSSFVG